jgi:protein-S-isoprenylcysteine O-methyltransferase Ste14
MSSQNNTIGKILYGILFAVVIPVILVIWTMQLDRLISVPAVQWPVAGALSVVAGLALMAFGMSALRKYGKGLPMNAFPPSVYVEQNVYRFVAHPIYAGFCLAVVGVSLFTGSGSGLFITTPLVMIGCAAIVLGYENDDIRNRFPSANTTKLIGLPGNSSDLPTVVDRLSVVLLFLLPAIVLGAALLFLFHPAAISPLAFASHNWLLVAAVLWGQAFVLYAPFVAKQKSELRSFCISGWVGMAMLFLLTIVWPPSGTAYSPLEAGYLGTPGIWDSSFGQFALFHLVFVGLSLSVYLHSLRFRSLAVALALPGIIALLSQSVDLLNCLVVTALAFAVSDNYATVWSWILRFIEHVANSWKEWTMGPVRVINHGFYVGIGTLLGVFVIGTLIGADNMKFIVVFGFIVIIISALWAQLIEGSEKLKRPFGFYGGMVGIVLGSITVYFMGADVWRIIAGISVVMPWIQAVGRMRCLVNGCCHGKVIEPPNGIHYYHYRSRVCGIAGLKGASLHPTPLYSILWLLPIGFLLLRAWYAGVTYSFLFGLYLLLTGLGRFVEEAYRGEPQTPVKGGLRLYQWAALASVILGILSTCISSPTPVIAPIVLDWRNFAGAATLGLFTFVAMGVDFPRSNARFSRLV